MTIEKIKSTIETLKVIKYNLGIEQNECIDTETIELIQEEIDALHTAIFVLGGLKA